MIFRLRNSLCSSGVVFLYREGSARYAFSFAGAQEACARIGARIATPEQLYAAYLGGYEQCDAGWLSDQTVRWVHRGSPGLPASGKKTGLRKVDKPLPRAYFSAPRHPCHICHRSRKVDRAASWGKTSVLRFFFS